MPLPWKWLCLECVPGVKLHFAVYGDVNLFVAITHAQGKERSVRACWRPSNNVLALRLFLRAAEALRKCWNKPRRVLCLASTDPASQRSLVGSHDHHSQYINNIKLQILSNIPKEWDGVSWKTRFVKDVVPTWCVPHQSLMILNHCLTWLSGTSL